MKTLRRTLVTVFALSLAAAISHAGEERAAPRLLMVSAQESVSIPATVARVTVMIEAREKTPDMASARAGAASQKVMEFLKSSGVGRLQTGGLAVNPIFSPRKSLSSGNDEMEVSGYLSQWTASFETPVEKAGKLVSTALELGVTRVTNFNLTATDDAIAAAQREALKLAATRARADANAILETLGYSAKEVVTIHVNSENAHPMAGRGMVAMSYSAKSAPALEGGMQEINGSVSLEVSY